MPRKKSNHSFDKKRRKFLKFIGLGSAVAIGQSAASQIRINKPVQQNREIVIAGNPAPNYISIKLLRPYDLLSLELRYYNFNLSGNILQKKGNPAYLVVVFQPQSISEQAWSETEGLFETPTIPGRILIGGESRLVFEIPAAITSIPLDLNELLAWEKYDPIVNERAKLPALRRLASPVINQKINAYQQRVNTRVTTTKLPATRGLSKDEKLTINSIIIPENSTSRADAIVNIRGNVLTLIKDAVGPLGELETSLEVPLRLYLSPTKLAGWKHLKKLNPDTGIIKQTNKLFELWHTRMGTKTVKGIDETDATYEQRIFRVLWADDANKNYEENVNQKVLDSVLGRTSLTNKDRHQLVHESSNFQIPGFMPQPVKARKLFLTTLGAWLTSEFAIDRKKLATANIIQPRNGKDNALNLLSWKHIATMGRDHYVEIVKAGNIIPFGNEAVLVKITERKPHAGTGTAANFQREFVIITETSKDFNYYDSKDLFMNFCFSRVEFVTTTSPLLDTDKLPLATPDTGTMAAINQFIIRSKQTNVLFKIKAEDLDGNLVDFLLPLAFVSTEAQDNGTNITALVTAYNDEDNISPKSLLNGQKFTLAPQAINGCDTAYVASDISFGMMKYQATDELQGFLPVMKQANIIEPSYQRLTGIAQTVPVSLVGDRNEGHVFAKFNIAKPVLFSGQSDKTGGLAAPNFNLSGLSKAAGAFGGNIEKFKTATASADDFFKVSSLPDPTLFGVFKLSDILDFVTGDKTSYDLSKPLLNRVPKIPNLVTEETTTEFITTYVIKPQLKNISLGFAGFTKKAGAEFAITTQVKAKKNNPTAPEFSTDAWVRNFQVGIMKLSGGDYLVGIDFNEIRFTTTAGKKADVSVQMGDPCMVFGGPLSFINQITKLIDPKGFYDPPYLDVSLTGIKCGYTLALPNLQMGAFTLSHLSLSAEVNLPFTGGPLTMGFRFCERQQPFTLTVACLGGGGFFGMEVDMNGLRQIEAALEFGAAVSLNLGVASGAVSVMAGIYFKMTFEAGHNSTQLTGYVRINGAVSVLGLITASIELYMALTYLIDKKKAYGEASLKIKVEVLFFSKTVTIKTQRTFAGNGSDPNFQMALTQGDWQEYCGAFAA
jgi:hypothetical protein